jgi:hypothetical protein
MPGENSGPAGAGHSRNPPPPPPRKTPPPPPPPPKKPQSDGAQAAQAAAQAAQAAAQASKLAAMYAQAGPNFSGAGAIPSSPPPPPPPTPPPPTPPPRSTKNDSSTTPPKVIDTPIEVPQFMEPTPEPVATIAPSPVRIAARNVFDISSLVPQFDAEQIQKLLFENISAIELSIAERHDTIEGINQRYSIISNLSEVRKKYDISKQLSIMDKFKPLTSIYTINIEDKIPQEDYIRLQKLDSTYQYLDENNKIITRQKGYYYIDTNGDLVIELINLEKNQQVEVLIDTNGTIYKIEKVES